VEYYIEKILPIIALIVSFTVGAYTALLFYRHNSSSKESYIQSLFYHQVLLLIFGFYGLVGSVLLSNFLLKYYVNLDIIKKAVSLVFYMSYPFMIASVFMLIKAGIELLGKKVKMLWIILYFILMVLVALILVFTIDEILIDFNYRNFVSPKYLLFLFFEGVLIVVFCIFSFITVFKKKHSVYIKAVFVYYLVYHVFVSIVFLMSNYLDIARIYFVLLYFTGNIFLVFLIPKIQLSTQTKENGANYESLYLRYEITKREREIIQEICAGKTNQEIADTLFISLQTVKDHIHNIFRKVEVKNRIQLRNIFSN
jgi:DNA-binding CsgD family transcriptional regulator